eukprot:TRINITY_DN10260_c0_g1_i1.p1 TRINITY_DN10260_c0_g1~~TRINITY_DN10260_c0_g1_i1.p1  ORF type:complete len:338 (+),score=56.24 TRINITY_DN10260_c0_g1_i1:29-1042(+)
MDTCENSDIKAELDRSLKLLREGNFDDALHILLSLLDHNPDNAMGHNWVAMTFYHLTRYQDALEHFNEALKLSPKNPTLLSNRAACYMRMDKLSDAEKDCDKSLRIRPNHVNTLNNRGNIKKRQGKFESCICDFHSALSIRNHLETLNSRGIAFYEYGYNEEALRDFRSSNDYYPDSSIRFNIIKVLIAIEEYGQALEEINSLMEEREHYHFYVFRSIVHSKLKEFSNAQKDIDQVSELLIDRTDTFYLKLCQGICAMEQNNWLAAKNFFDSGWQGNSMVYDNCDILAYRGYCFWRLEKFTKAKSDIDRALSYRPKHKIWSEWRIEIRKKRAFGESG